MPEQKSPLDRFRDPLSEINSDLKTKWAQISPSLRSVNTQLAVHDDLMCAANRRCAEVAVEGMGLPQEKVEQAKNLARAISDISHVRQAITRPAAPLHTTPEDEAFRRNRNIAIGEAILKQELGVTLPASADRDIDVHDRLGAHRGTLLNMLGEMFGGGDEGRARIDEFQRHSGFMQTLVYSHVVGDEVRRMQPYGFDELDEKLEKPPE